jgi:hypothetical protein
VVGDQGEEVLAANKRPAVAGEHDNRQRSEDGVDGAALEPKLSQVGAAEESALAFK